MERAHLRKDLDVRGLIPHLGRGRGVSNTFSARDKMFLAVAG